MDWNRVHSDVFCGLTSAYIVRKAEGNWLEFEMPIWFTLSTIAVIASSLSLWCALTT